MNFKETLIGKNLKVIRVEKVIEENNNNYYFEVNNKEYKVIVGDTWIDRFPKDKLYDVYFVEHFPPGEDQCVDDGVIKYTCYYTLEPSK